MRAKLINSIKLIYSIMSYGPGFGAIGHFLSSVVGHRKGPSGANDPPVHGIKKCLGSFADIMWILLVFTSSLIIHLISAVGDGEGTS